MKKLFVLIIQLISWAVLHGQMVYTEPPLPVMGTPVQVFYDTSKDPGELKNYTEDIYAHTGVILKGNTSWQHVIGTWGYNSTQPKLTYLGNYLYRLDISPDIKTYYSLADNDSVQKLAFVFRNAAGTHQTRPDIFLNVYGEGLQISILQPAGHTLLNRNSDLFISAATSLYADITLALNNSMVKTESGTSINHTIHFSDAGDYWIRVSANDGSNRKADSVFVHVLGDQEEVNLPEQLADGINYIEEDSVVLVLYAPEKQHVFVIGDFNDWTPGADYRMMKDGDRYWISLSNLTPGEEYAFQYLVDGTLRIADPYTSKVLDPWNDPYITPATYPDLKPYPAGRTEGIVAVLQTGQTEYVWNNDSYIPPPKEKLVIYEMLLRDFLAAHDWKTLADTLNYFDNLGITAIEIMPFNEFEGNLSWGYNPSFYFAPDKYYGTVNDLKAFVDSCHGRGIAVIMDIVLNHANNSCPLAQLYWDEANNKPASSNPWFNPDSPNPSLSWGNDFNHESEATKAFVESVTSYWLMKYRIDGFRFDFSKGFTNTPGDGSAYDASRIAILKRIADHIRAVNPDAYIILEHFGTNPEEEELANHGMMLWGEMTSVYALAAQGKTSDLSWATYKARSWEVPHLISYMESHDKERLMVMNLSSGASSGTYNTREPATALKRMEAVAVFLLAIPGPKMIWQFGEMGYDVSIDYGGKLSEKPIRWYYLSEPGRQRLYQVYKCMNELRKEHEAFHTDTYTYSLDGLQKRITLNHASMDITVLGNFGLTEATIPPAFTSTGKWYEYFTGDSLQVSDINQLITLRAGEYRIYTSKRLQIPDYFQGTEDLRFQEFDLRVGIYPNPSPEGCTFIVESEKAETISLSISDISGRLVKAIVSNQKVKGTEYFRWDGLTESGYPAPPGIYFLQITTPVSGKTIRIIKT